MRATKWSQWLATDSPPVMLLRLEWPEQSLPDDSTAAIEGVAWGRSTLPRG